MFSFDQIYGNEHIISSLQNAITNNRVSHAYIFSGEAGIGKKLLANTFAKTLQCEKGGATPCNQCPSCHLFEAGNHPDVFHIRPSKTNSLGVDDVRDYISKPMNVKPFKYSYKIFIIENGDVLTPMAQNALLKTIEEPASYGVFIFLSESIGNFLSTILSRCVIFKLKLVPLPKVEKYLLEKASQTVENAATYAIYSEGNIGHALALLNDENFLNMRDEILNISSNLRDCNHTRIFSLVKQLENYKNNINEVLDILFFWYRDLAILKETENVEYLTQKDKKNMLMAQVENYSLSAILNNIDAIQKSKWQLKYHGNFQLIMEVLLLTLKE